MYRLFPFVNLFYLSAPEPVTGEGEKEMAGSEGFEHSGSRDGMPLDMLASIAIPSAPGIPPTSPATVDNICRGHTPLPQSSA